MTRIKAPANLPELVRTTFNEAKRNGHINFYPTQAAILNVNSIPFQLRFSPALASKPKPPPPPPSPSPSSQARPPFDPFADPAPALVVARLEPPDHYLVLNKFAVVPEHFILATAAFAPQAHLLAPADLAAARACVDAYHARGGQRLFVFFNSGAHSGASQAHRHLQLLPVERMRDGLVPGGGGGAGAGAEAPRWEVLADVLLAREEEDGGAAAAATPFRCFVERLPASSDDDDTGMLLHAAYLRLYRRACQAVLGTAEEAVEDEGEARISYNLAMTRDAMVLCPRRAEGGPIVSAAAGGGGGGGEEEVGRLSLNGTVLAGTALVKSQAEWDALRADPGQLLRVLAKI